MASQILKLEAGIVVLSAVVAVMLAGGSGLGPANQTWNWIGVLATAMVLLPAAGIGVMVLLYAARHLIADDRPTIVGSMCAGLALLANIGVFVGVVVSGSVTVYSVAALATILPLAISAVLFVALRSYVHW